MPDLWILAGQSNMEGCGDLINVEQSDPSVRLFAHGDVWKTAEEPLHWLSEAVDPVHWRVPVGDLQEQREIERKTRTKGAGCGLPFAKIVGSATHQLVDLLPVAHGGTSMQQWSPALKDEGGSSLYGAMLRRVRLALETSPESVVKGVLWYQGESDCNPTDAPRYKERMQELVSSWRADLDIPDLPFLIVQLGVWAQPGRDNTDGEAAWTRVREEQRLLPQSVSNLYVAPAIDLDIDDGIHIGTPGLKRLGNRLAHIALQHVYRINSPQAIEFAGARLQDDNAVRVSFKNVTGGFRAVDPAGRIPGFGLVTGGVYNDGAFYKVRVDPTRPSDLLLFPAAELAPESRLTYGYGLFPFCQLTDAKDMAAPAFGPVEIAR